MNNLIKINEASKLLRMSTTAVYKKLKRLKKIDKKVYKEVVKQVQGVTFIDIDYFQKDKRGGNFQETNEEIKRETPQEVKTSEVERLYNLLLEEKKARKDSEESLKVMLAEQQKITNNLTGAVLRLQAPIDEVQTKEETIRKYEEKETVNQVQNHNKKVLLSASIVIIISALVIVALVIIYLYIRGGRGVI